MTDAEIACDAYHARKAQWPGSKFKAGRGVKREYDKSLPNTYFYRFRDGSVMRIDNGDAQA